MFDFGGVSFAVNATSRHGWFSNAAGASSKCAYRIQLTNDDPAWASWPPNTSAPLSFHVAKDGTVRVPTIDGKPFQRAATGGVGGSVGGGGGAAGSAAAVGCAPVSLGLATPLLLGPPAGSHGVFSGSFGSLGVNATQACLSGVFTWSVSPSPGAPHAFAGAGEATQGALQSVLSTAGAAPALLVVTLCANTSVSLSSVPLAISPPPAASSSSSLSPAVPVTLECSAVTSPPSCALDGSGTTDLVNATAGLKLRGFSLLNTAPGGAASIDIEPGGAVAVEGCAFDAGSAFWLGYAAASVTGDFAYAPPKTGR